MKARARMKAGTRLHGWLSVSGALLMSAAVAGECRAPALYRQQPGLVEASATLGGRIGSRIGTVAGAPMLLFSGPIFLLSAGFIRVDFPLRWGRAIGCATGAHLGGLPVLLPKAILLDAPRRAVQALRPAPMDTVP